MLHYQNSICNSHFFSVSVFSFFFKQVRSEQLTQKENTCVFNVCAVTVAWPSELADAHASVTLPCRRLSEPWPSAVSCTSAGWFTASLSATLSPFYFLLFLIVSSSQLFVVSFPCTVCHPSVRTPERLCVSLT